MGAVLAQRTIDGILSKHPGDKGISGNNVSRHSSDITDTFTERCEGLREDLEALRTDKLPNNLHYEAKEIEYLHMARMMGEEGRRIFAEYLCNRYREELLVFARKKLGNSEEAKDIVQETLLKAYKSLDTFQDKKASIGIWLYTIARNNINDYYRKDHRRPSGLDNMQVEHLRLLRQARADYRDPLDSILDKEQADIIRSAIDRLPSAMARAVRMAYIDGMPYQLIAEREGVPVGTIKSRVHIAKERMGEYIARIG